MLEYTPSSLNKKNVKKKKEKKIGKNVWPRGINNPTNLSNPFYDTVYIRIYINKFILQKKKK